MHTAAHKAPEDCGRRLIPTLVDEIARNDPNRPFLSVPLDPTLGDGYEDVCYGSFAKAVNKCAWWLESKLGKSSTFETITYISHARDMTYLILILAAVKTGYKVGFDDASTAFRGLYCVISRLYMPLPGIASRPTCH